MSFFLANVAYLYIINTIMYKVKEIAFDFWWKNLTVCRLFLTFLNEHKVSLISMPMEYRFDWHMTHFLNNFLKHQKVECLCETNFHTIISKSVVVIWQKFDIYYYPNSCEKCEGYIGSSYTFVKLDLFHSISQHSNFENELFCHFLRPVCGHNLVLFYI